MPLDVLLPLGIVFAVSLIAFSVSVAIGLAVGHLGLDELDDKWAAQPVSRGWRPPA